MTAVTVTKNYQVSIPAWYRKKHSIQPQQKLEPIETPEGLLYRKSEISSRADIKSLVGDLPHRTDEEIQQVASEVFLVHYGM